MPRKSSAGIVLFRRRADGVQVLLVHPGGPFWAKKDRGAWSIPKGEPAEGEDPLEAARREFTEETGFTVDGEFHALHPVKQGGGKTVAAWAIEGDCDPEQLRSNAFEMEWPPRSGTRRTFPEVDRAAWFSLADARERIIAGQAPLLDQLIELVMVS